MSGGGEFGFADPEMAKAAAAKWERRRDAYVAALRLACDDERALCLVSANSQRETQMVEQRIERLRSLKVVIFNGVAAKHLRNAQRRLRSARKHRFNGDDMGDQQVFDRTESRTDFASHPHSPAAPLPGRMAEAPGASSSGRGGPEA